MKKVVNIYQEEYTFAPFSPGEFVIDSNGAFKMEFYGGESGIFLEVNGNRFDLSYPVAVGGSGGGIPLTTIDNGGCDYTTIKLEGILKRASGPTGVVVYVRYYKYENWNN